MYIIINCIFYRLYNKDIPITVSESIPCHFKSSEKVLQIQPSSEHVEPTYQIKGQVMTLLMPISIIQVQQEQRHVSGLTMNGYNSNASNRNGDHHHHHSHHNNNNYF